MFFKDSDPTERMFFTFGMSILFIGSAFIYLENYHSQVVGNSESYESGYKEGYEQGLLKASKLLRGQAYASRGLPVDVLTIEESE